MTRRGFLLALAGARAIPPAHLLVDIRSQRVVNASWPDPDAAIPVGSLLKPFTGMAYGAAHDWHFPVLDCKRCWKPDGHGRLDFVHALAVSCNSYFLELASHCQFDEVQRLSSTFDLPGPSGDRPEDWVGLSDGWRVGPRQLLRAYSELFQRAALPGPALVLAGMRLAGRSGTARVLQGAALAKTGTSPCTHRSHGMGDGLAVALFPPAAPTWALLTSLHNQPGSHAAAYAAELIKRTLG